MTDNVAILEGYTKGVRGMFRADELYLLVKPDTDLGERFKAWDTDCQEFITVNGWLGTFEPLPETREG